MLGAALACIGIAFFGAMSVGRLSYTRDADAYSLLLYSLSALACGVFLLAVEHFRAERCLRAAEAEAEAYLTCLMEHRDAEDWERLERMKAQDTRH